MALYFVVCEVRFGWICWVKFYDNHWFTPTKEACNNDSLSKFQSLCLLHCWWSLWIVVKSKKNHQSCHPQRLAHRLKILMAVSLSFVTLKPLFLYTSCWPQAVDMTRPFYFTPLHSLKIWYVFGSTELF